MRVAWLVDDQTPATLIPDLEAYCTALARSGHEVEVFGKGGRPEWLADALAFRSVSSLRTAPEPLRDCDAAIGTHWSHAGACVDVGTAAPFLLIAEGLGDDVARTACSVPVNVLTASQEVAHQLRRAGARGNVHVVPGHGNGTAPAELSTKAGLLEDILVGAVRSHLARVPDEVTLGLAMIVRDEQESLRRCLASVVSLVDQMVVVDTGSRDATASVARDAGAAVVRHKWQNDFAAARNVALEHVTTDWVLVLDADEQVAPSSGPLLRRAIKNPLVDGFLLDIVNFTGDVTISGGASHANVRLFRRLPGVRYEGALHEQVGPCLLRAGGVIRPLPEVVILHYGYLGATVEGYDKKRRNLEIVRRQAEEDPHNPFVQFNLAVEYMRQGDRSRAIKIFQRAFRLLPGPGVPYAPALVRHLVACLIDERRHDEALAVLEQAQDLYPDYVDLHYLRGLVLNRLGRYEDALEALSECLRMGDAPSVYMFSQLGAGSFLARAASVESYLGLGRLDEAVEARNTVAKEMSEQLGGVLPALHDKGRHVLSLWVQAEEHLRGGRLREAVTAYRQLLSSEVRQAFLTTQLAQLCPRKAVLELVAGEARLARQDLDLLAGVNPRAARGARLLLEPWLTPGGEAGAGENTGFKETPAGEDSRLGWRDVASVLVTLLDVGRRDWFERACDRLRSGLMDPGQLDRELGKLYFQRGLHEKAAAHLLAGVQQGCTDAAALRALGEISLARGLHAEARTFFREAVRQRPADASAWVSLALSYHRVGRDRAGLRVLELARRYTGGAAIHTARLALSIRLQLAGRDGRNARMDVRHRVAGEVS
ncbi:MAG: glycosyltransferase [Firmicutes bacterium]|nr:glycosyltransferase [Bacillota bacterium]